MAYIPVPKDLSKVKTKVAMGLTKRQLICFSGAGLLGLPLYFVTRGLIGNDFAALLLVVAVIPFFFFALYQKNGQPAETVLKNMIHVRFRTPCNRPYQTENMYRYLQDTAHGPNGH